MNEHLRKTGIVPVLKITDANKALPLADALYEGGLDILEVTFRTDAAAQAIEKISAAREKVVVGAGTVLSVEQLRRAMESGAKFAVSPGFNRKVAEYALSQNFPFFPGVITPTEVEAALELGYRTLKFFPAESFGGVKTLKSLSAPYSMVSWMPTGGINAQNIADYLSFEKVIACGASCMAEEKLIAAEDYAEITRRARQLCAVRDEVRK